ncbi:hypothetical protein G4Z16_00575 [Streptomyces bathyalis]|uniref:Uncharacterized protein n=1 Tax=Streptomyces bathyalis TaxID=2710756 RepID=A0A7T1T2D8_9ACTN|nr:hypothetical protein [Streptomyces bathyalis]QPP05132.1 hypothetical protein G4Z16_00575 [Streptomyces bathyalis]
MSVYQVSCPARTLILDEERRLLEEGGLRIEPTLWCTLEAEHGGLHLTLAQALKGGGGVPPSTLWLRWPEDAEHGPLRELLTLPSCPERFLAGTVEEEVCDLPKDHAGRHGFEFGPPLNDGDITPDWLL